MTDGLDAMRASLRTDRPTPARMYDYYLGGKDNFAVDRAVVDAMSPEMTELLRNAVRVMSIAMAAVCWNLGTADDRREEFV
jgi:hypothetical protein